MFIHLTSVFGDVLLNITKSFFFFGWVSRHWSINYSTVVCWENMSQGVIHTRKSPWKLIKNHTLGFYLLPPESESLVGT